MTISPRKKQLKTLTSELKSLEQQLAENNMALGIDDNIAVEIITNQANYDKIKTPGEKDRLIGRFLLEINITAKTDVIFVPLSIASGKKPTGFVYLIEGSAEGTIITADVKCRGAGVDTVTLGTLLYAKIPAGKTALFNIQICTLGKINNSYNIVINCIRYKLKVTDVRYKQYIKELIGKTVTFR
jgi:hypothetical protein